MADAGDGFESASCHPTIELESVGTGTPNSLCSTPELEIRGNENCSATISKQSSKCDGSLANNCESRAVSHETSISKNSKLENIETSSTEANCKE